KCIPSQANTRNCDELTVQLIPMPSVPPQQDYAHSGRGRLQIVVPRLRRSYRSASSLVRSLPQSSLGKRAFLRNAIRLPPHRTDKRRWTRRLLRPETVCLPSARSQHRASRVAARLRNHPKSRRWLLKRDKLPSLAQHLSAPATASKLV